MKSYLMYWLKEENEKRNKDGRYGLKNSMRTKWFKSEVSEL